MKASTSTHCTLRSGAELMIEALHQQGVKTVFGYPGGAIMPLYDQLPDSGIQHILVRHEQAAALAADAYGRVTGEPGVCLATSGPGATNLLTGIANAHLDSAPLVAITGQVPTTMMGTDAFQEVDIFGMSLPIVKHSFIIRDAASLPGILDEAFDIARSGRPGPVLVDIPKDICQQQVSTQQLHSPTPKEVRQSETSTVDAANLQACIDLISEAQRPLLYLGGGIRIANAHQALRQWLGTSGIPTVCTLQALGSLPKNNPAFLGMLGMHGSPAANKAVQSCDLLIVIGARFDDRATGFLAQFAPNAKVIHIDADRAEISKLRAADIHIVAPLTHVFRELMLPTLAISNWQQQCSEWRQESQPRYDAPGQHIYAPALLKRLSELAPEAIITCDVGQHQMWVAQHCAFLTPRHHLTSGGLGTMGYGLPAAIGAKLAKPDALVICVSGDGSFMMNIQELATLRRYQIDIRMILLDNSCLGMVRQWQELFFQQNYSEVDLSDNPDFCQVTQSFGIQAFSIHNRNHVEAGLHRLLNHQGPCLMHVPIDAKANVWPLVPPGCSNEEMMGETAL